MHSYAVSLRKVRAYACPVPWFRLGICSGWCWYELVGVACPAHSGASDFPSLLLALTSGLGIGFSLGLVAATFMGLRLGLVPSFAPLFPSRAPTSSRVSSRDLFARLRGHVNERARGPISARPNQGAAK